MIFADLQFALTFVARLTNIDLVQDDVAAPVSPSLARIRYRYENSGRDSMVDLGLKPLNEGIDIPNLSERDIGIIVEVTPVVGLPDTPGEHLGGRQLSYIPSPHNDLRPFIVLCGSASPKRVRIGVLNYNRYAVLRRVQISESPSFTNPFTYDIYFDWLGARLPAPIGSEFLIKRTKTTGGATIYVRVAHAATLQTQWSADAPVTSPVLLYYYFKRPLMSPWSNTLAIAWPSADIQSGIDTPNGIVDFVIDESGLENPISGIGLTVIHPGATEFIEENTIVQGLGDATLNVVVGEDPIDAVIDFPCEIVSAEMFASTPGGDYVVDIWKCTQAAFDGGATHPVAGDKITASAPPTIVAGVKWISTALTGWSKTIVAGTVLRFVRVSATTIKYATVSLKLRRVA